MRSRSLICARGRRRRFSPPNVTGSLSITPPPAWSDLVDAEVTARTVTQIGDELQDLLVRAQRLDDETTQAVRSNIPAPGFGFGSQAAWAVPRDTVAQQQGRTPAEVRDWWQTLSPEQQEQVIRDYPDLFGWLNGVPAADRDHANRLNLASRLDALGQREVELTRKIAEARHVSDLNSYRAQLEDVRAEEVRLRTVHDKVAEFGARALLMGIDGQGDGKAIISLGNPDTAAHTAVFVPGVNTDLLDAGGDMDRVYNLREKADSLTPAGNDVAVVWWLGYDAPTEVNAIGYGASHDGAAAFAPFVEGLRATHQPSNDPYHVTAVGHSYGSGVIAESAMTGRLAVDDIVTAGSPGMHTDHADDLNIDPRHVWAGEAEGDLIADELGGLLGIHGQEPTDPDFGANRYQVDTQGHSAYWTEGSQSLTNQANIVVGQYARVSYYYGSPPQ
jgi:hypothetical protein